MNKLPWIIRHKWLILAGAITSFALLWVFALVADSNGKSVPPTVFGPFALLFIWGNGTFWWLRFYYPDQPVPESEPPRFESPMSRAGPYMRLYAKTFFWGYGVIAWIITSVIVRLMLQ